MIKLKHAVKITIETYDRSFTDIKKIDAAVRSLCKKYRIDYTESIFLHKHISKKKEY